MSTKPTDFLKNVVGRPVVVKLNSGVTYRGLSTEEMVLRDFRARGRLSVCIVACRRIWRMSAFLAGPLPREEG
jgi:hypothetical protein